jgi:NAD(P)-dependent dehydrogenase (short-subunit alcohol dehydrogenase family)
MPSDFSPKRMRVNAITPGGIDSDMAVANSWRYVPGATEDTSYTEAYAALGEFGPLKRFGTPEYVARTVASLPQKMVAGLMVSKSSPL